MWKPAPAARLGRAQCVNGAHMSNARQQRAGSEGTGEQVQIATIPATKGTP